MTPSTEQKYLSLKHAATYADIPLSTLEKHWPLYEAHGWVISKMPNGRIRVLKSSIDKFMDAGRVTHESIRQTP